MQPRLMNFTLAAVTSVAMLLSFTNASAHPYEDPKKRDLVSTENPKELQEIEIQEKLGAQLDTSVMVRSEQGQVVPLSTYFSSGKPVIFSLVYYSCPGLCNFHLNGLFEALKNLEWNPGRDFEVVALSFDHRETPDTGAAKKRSYMEMYARGSVVESGIHFLTADEAAIKKITEQVGFRYKWNEESKEWGHSSAAIFVSPDGKLTRYLHGIMFEAKNIKLALSEGGQGKIGSFVDQVVWRCFKWDPKKSVYTFYAFRLMQLGGFLMILVMAALLIPNWIRSRRLERGRIG